MMALKAEYGKLEKAVLEQHAEEDNRRLRLLEELKDSSQYPDRRRRAQDALERRAKEDRLRHLVDLHARSSYELDQIASNEGDFAVRRALAKQLLDERLALEDKKG